ncbi:MAG: hypothetical protein WBP26_02000 [Candidatus Saccharimonadales bacterium]
MSTVHYFDHRVQTIAHFELSETAAIANIAAVMEPTFHKESESGGMQELFLNHAAHVFVCDAVHHIASKDRFSRRFGEPSHEIHPGLVHVIRPFVRNTHQPLLVPVELPSSLKACETLLSISAKRLWHSAVSRHIALYQDYPNMAIGKSKVAMAQSPLYHQRIMDLLKKHRKEASRGTATLLNIKR